MNKFKITVNRFDEAKKNLIKSKMITLETIGLFVENRASLLAPVDTGNLRQSIDHKTEKNSVHIGTNTEYAPYQEFGTVKQKAQPFLTPAVERNKKQIQKIVRDIYKGGIKWTPLYY